MNTVIDTLIYDRTQEDVDKVFALKHKILTKGLTALSVEEKDEYMAGMKGAYNYTDMNRVGQAVSYIATRMTHLPEELSLYMTNKGVADDTIYHVPYNPSSIQVSPKTDWRMEDVPTQSQTYTFLNNIVILRKQVTLPNNAPDVPSSLDYFTFKLANDIEYLLYLIDSALTKIEKDLYSKINHASVSFAYTGILNCGE